MINTAGAASSTIKLYNGWAVTTTALIASIDATQTGQMFCYPAAIFSGALGVAVASGGAAPDVTITYQSLTGTTGQ